MITPEEFREACIRHDLTFEYADDNSAWRRGVESYKRLHLMALELGYEIAAPIFNAVVDKKIIPSQRERFYWKVREVAA